MRENFTLKKCLNENWLKKLENEFNSTYFIELMVFLEQEKKSHEIFPKENKIFEALNITPFDEIKVVILGQDPYHRVNQANGLSFSVSNGVKIPPSLRNIFKEIQTDLGFSIPKDGNLISWAKQGVLLLNSCLTVRENEAGSHHNRGWENFTDAIIKLISNEKTSIIFLLWGKFAEKKDNLIDENKHYILKAAHPSPLARGAFFGCKHFSKTNEILKNNKQIEIDWKID
jgi:uracil-DNA glycosylase